MTEEKPKRVRKTKPKTEHQVKNGETRQFRWNSRRAQLRRLQKSLETWRTIAHIAVAEASELKKIVFNLEKELQVLKELRRVPWWRRALEKK